MKNIFTLIVLFLTISTAYSQTEFKAILNQKVKLDKGTKSQEIFTDERLSTPKATMTTFIEAMDKVKKGDNGAIQDAILTLDLSKIDQGSRRSIGKLTAERLVNTIDRISKVNFDFIPTYSEGAPWYFRKETINLNKNIHDVEIAIHKTNEGWKFTPSTIDTIEDYYHSVENNKVVDGVVALKSWKTNFKNQFPKWTSERLIILKNGQWVSLFFLFLSGIILFYFVRMVISYYSKDNIELKDRYKSTLPFGLLSFSLFIKYTIVFLELDLEFLEVILRINYILTAITAVWASLKIVDYVSFKFERKALLSPNKFDDVLVPMLKKTAKVVVVSFGALFVAHSLTFDIGSILAGLGIGGVAVALAAKDTISNLFGSVTVILDRPFNIGDYIVLEKNLEGTVEQVGFRSTRIRTPLNSLVSMPNSVLANMAIDNYGMRNFRRFKTTLQIEHGTDALVIESFIQKLRYQIQLNPKVEKNEVPVQIYINELGESSINVLLSIYFIADTAQVELEERHKLIIDIMNLAKESGISFAFPTRTLLVKKEEES